MLHEHDEGRSHVRTIREALRSVERGDRSAREVVRLAAAKFCELLRQHIAKENQILFVIGDQAMSEATRNCFSRSSTARSTTACRPARTRSTRRWPANFARRPGWGRRPAPFCTQTHGIHSCHHE